MRARNDGEIKETRPSKHSTTEAERLRHNAQGLHRSAAKDILELKGEETHVPSLTQKHLQLAASCK